MEHKINIETELVARADASLDIREELSRVDPDDAKATAAIAKNVRGQQADHLIADEKE